MTKLLFLDDAYMQQIDAVVTGVLEDGRVILDQTVFYAGGGGQPCDTGTLTDLATGNSFAVTKVGRVSGSVVHTVAAEPAMPVGTTVRAAIDWDRRYQLMRTHTALHILCGVVWRDFGALVTGGDMRPGTARMDFELENMSAEFAHEVETTINLEVARERDINVDYLHRSAADAHPDLIRTKVNLLPAGITEVRTIDISGLDLQADGGTHVRNTREVGRIRVVGHESKGRINKRLRIELE